MTKYLERQLKEGGFVLSHCASVRRLMVGQPETEGKLEMEGQSEMEGKLEMEGQPEMD